MGVDRLIRVALGRDTSLEDTLFLKAERDTNPVDTVVEFRKALEFELDALRKLVDNVDDSIESSVETLWSCTGKVVVCGMGKCGHIGQKIAATFVSTGTPAVFLHPADAIHGDLGYVLESDVVLALSYSGETREMRALIPLFKRLGLPIVAITGRPESTLGTRATSVIDVSVDREAGPIDMVPTASTTAMLAAGDALAVVLMRKRAFTKDDFAALHPGGSLGQKLLCRVCDIMHVDDSVPIVEEGVTLREAILEMTSKRLGATFLVNSAGELSGIITDGDLRRLMQSESSPLDFLATDVMTHGPKALGEEVLAVDALQLMEDSSITILPVIDDGGKPVGALQIHDLIRAGIA